jgi:transposase
VQALERVAPTLPAQRGRPAYHEPEYVRHGAVSLFSVLHVRKGDVFTECIDDHTSSTILSCVKKHALQFGKTEELHYICDNYSSHSTELFCEGIAELCRVRLPKIETLLQRTDKRIVFHFLPTHGSWLNLIEIWFGILQQKAIKDQSFSSKTELINRIIDFTKTWNKYFAHPFQWTYTGHGLHEKVIGRFTRWLQMQSPQLNGKFLEKQLRLMSHLADKYWSKVKNNVWSLLQETLSENHDFIEKIILQHLKLDPVLLSNLQNRLHLKLDPVLLSNLQNRLRTKLEAI